MLRDIITSLEPYVKELNHWGVAAGMAATLLVGLSMKKWRKPHITAVCFTVFYLCLVYTSTVLSRIPGRGVGIAIRPFWSYIQWIQGDDIFLKYIVLNILMLVPVGISLSFVWKSRKRIAVSGFIFSCLIEISQLLTARGLFEIDDILHNTAGILLGMLLYASIVRITNNYKR